MKHAQLFSDPGKKGLEPIFWGLDHFSGAATKKEVGQKLGH